nr:MAG TPA: minor tail protein [Caudoviricetes sp.]
MLDFPESISAPDYPLQEALEDAVLRSNMEDGTVKTRPKFTRNRKTFEIKWGHMTDVQKQTFENFYVSSLKNGSLPFNWIHPQTGKAYVVVFSEPPSMALTILHYWSINAKLREV